MPIMAKSNDEYTEVKAIKTPDGTEIDYVLSKVDNTYKRTYTAIRELEDTPPLEFKSIKPNANLTDYRIYGQTVDGESVGDRTGNLFYKKIENTNISSNGGIYSDNYDLWIGKVIAGETYTAYNINSVVGFFTDEPNYGRYTYNSSRIVDATTVYTFTVPSGCSYVAIRFLKNATRAMLNLGDTALPYEPYGYKVPVTVSNDTDTLTTPIYLPEQIRKVGDEAEYIDYGEQRQHRVRKNLLQNIATSQTINGVTFTVNSDGSVTCNGKCVNNVAVLYIKRPTTFYDETIQYTLTGCPVGGAYNSTYVLEYTNSVNQSKPDVGNGVSFTPYRKEFYPNACIRIVIFVGYTCDNLTFYPMIRKASITDDTYEPYIENTEVDVTLPALPTVAGTNVLSVGTEVQPSVVYIKGKIKEVN